MKQTCHGFDYNRIKAIRLAVTFILLTPLVCNAQKAYRISGGETGPKPVSSNVKAFRVKEVLSNNTQEYSRNKAFSLNEEAEYDSYASEVSVAVGMAIPCAPFTSHVLEDVVQGAKIGTSAHINYTIWFIKYMGFGIDINGGFLGYDFSKTPSYTPAAGQTIRRTFKTGWNLISAGISLRTKFPIYQNSVFLTGRVFLQYGMLNSPTSKVFYKTEVGVTDDDKPIYQNNSTILFQQFVSQKLILGGGIGVKIRVKKRLYVLANFDYSYATLNNTKPTSYSARGLISNYSAFSIEAGVAYAF
jgi:hypothetical protein